MRAEIDTPEAKDLFEDHERADTISFSRTDLASIIRAVSA